MIACLLMMTMSVQANVISVLDSESTRITLKKPAVRILSLAPNLSEILFDVGALKQIVGRDKCSDYPSAILKIPIVADYAKLNLESIVKLHPDLVVLEHSCLLKEGVTRLRSLGIPVYINSARNINSIAKTLIDLGILSGHEVNGKQKAKIFDQTIEKCRKKGAAKITVFYELWNAPLLTVNDKTVIGQIIELCGGINIFGNLSSQTPKLSLESVVKANPDIIITSVPQGSWSNWSKLKAVKHNQVYYLSADIIERTGPRLLIGIDKICTIIHAMP